MNLLVTGGCGFIGSNLIRNLINKKEVKKLVNIDCLTYAGDEENLSDISSEHKYTFEKVNICNKSEVFRVFSDHSITHVMHLAAESHVDRSISGPGEFIQTNIVGTFNILEACRSNWTVNLDDYRFLHVSTDEVYGSLGETGLFSETTPYSPNSPYSASKASSDMLVRAYHHTYGLPMLITNCSNNYGPYQYPEKLIPVVIQNIINCKEIPIYGNGMNIRDWLYVIDHAEALWTVLLKGKNGETYNIGGNNEWANINIVNIICDIIDSTGQSNEKNSRKLITYIKDRPGHDKRYAIDATKIKNELGWVPRHNFEQGIEKTILWYLKNQNWVKRKFEVS